MATSLAEVRELVLALDVEDRETLAQELVSSLPQPELTEIDKAWFKEADRRYRDYKEDKVKLIPGDEVFARLEKKFG